MDTNEETNITGLFGSEELSAEDTALRNELAAAGAQILGYAEAAFDTDLDVETAEMVASQLVSQKDSSEAQLSYALYTLKDKKAYIDEGYEKFSEYVEARLKFSGAKANNLIKRWEAFTELGLASNALHADTGVSWSKFGELLPGVRAGVIDDSNIETWLPLATNSGPYSLTNKGIATMVRQAVADASAEEDPEKLESLNFKVSADDRAYILRDVDTIKNATGVLNGGEVLRLALESKVSEIATDSEDVRRNYGLSRLKQLAERMAPGISVAFLAEPGSGLTSENLGIVPITKVYAKSDQSAFTLATTDEEASDVLGTDDLVSFELVIPKNEVEEVEEVEDTISDEDDLYDFDAMSVDELKKFGDDLIKDLTNKEFITDKEVEALKSRLLDNGGNEAYNWTQLCEELVEVADEFGLQIN